MKYCPSCGAQNADDTKFCSKCGKPVGEPVSVPGTTGVSEVKNNLVKAILATLFCCLPLGIVAIVYASQVNSKLAAGDINGAVQASKNADTWANWSIGVGLVFGIIYFIVTLASRH
jgi:uncharacterized membrane protein YvbJ